MDSQMKLGPWVRRFLLEYLVADRNLSPNTQRSYRDSLALLLPFAAKALKMPVDQMLVEHLSAEVIRSFLKHLEEVRECCVATRNQRLASVHALARFIAERSPEHIAWSGEIRCVPFKKAARPHIHYLDKIEIDAVLAAARSDPAQSHSHYALLLFLYNSGARASEAVNLKIADLEIRSASGTQQHVVRIHGKGSKVRYCPLWQATADALSNITASRSPDERVFLNRLKQPFTRNGLYDLVERYGKRAIAHQPSLGGKKVTPHIVRHTTACHLLKAGVDINTIRAWLGHVSLDTTNIYAEIDLDMKAKALSSCEINGRRPKPWKEDASLMAFLKAL